MELIVCLASLIRYTSSLIVASYCSPLRDHSCDPCICCAGGNNLDDILNSTFFGALLCGYALILRCRLSLLGWRCFARFTLLPGSNVISVGGWVRQIAFCGRSTAGHWFAVDSILEMSEEISTDGPSVLVFLQERERFDNLRSYESKIEKA